MGDYLQARAWLDGGEVKRMYYLWGDEPYLTSDLIDTIRDATEASDMDRSTVFATEVDDVADLLDGYSLTDGSPRCVTVHEADRVDDWSKVLDWATSRRSPQTTAIFVDPRAKVPTDSPILQRIKKSGRIIDSTVTNEDKAVQILQSMWLVERHPAKYAYARCGSVSGACWTLAKGFALGGEITPRVIDLLTADSADPDEVFVEALMAIDRAKAMTVATEINPPKVFGALAMRLPLVAVVYRGLQRDLPMRTLAASLGQYSFLLGDLVRVARSHDPTATARRAKVLAGVEQMWTEGARVGVVESMVVQW